MDTMLYDVVYRWLAHGNRNDDAPTMDEGDFKTMRWSGVMLNGAECLLDNDSVTVARKRDTGRVLATRQSSIRYMGLLQLS